MPTAHHVQDAIVTTRTNDHKFWTFSRPTGADGKYTSFLVAADQEGDNPVPMTVGVAVGPDAYAEPLTDFINFPELQSANLDIQLPAPAGGTLVKSTLNPQALPGAIYQGLLVGVVGKGRPIKPVSATWPDAKGRFELVLPSSARRAHRPVPGDRAASSSRPPLPCPAARSYAPTTPHRCRRGRTPGASSR